MMWDTVKPGTKKTPCSAKLTKGKDNDNINQYKRGDGWKDL